MPLGCWGRDHETLVSEAGRDEGRAALEILVHAPIAPGPAHGRTYALDASSRFVQPEWAAALRSAGQGWRSPGSVCSDASASLQIGKNGSYQGQPGK